MKKCLKIIPVWLGSKRDFNGNRDTKDYIDDIIKNEIEIENGMHVDVCFTIQKTKDEKLNSLLDKYNNTKTKNGKIFVRKRENTALSFGGYLWTYTQYKNDYDYFFFTEDDVVLFRDNVIKNFADYLDKNKDCSFLALMPIIGDKWCRENISPLHVQADAYMPNLKRLTHYSHAGGGIGMTTKTHMDLSYPEPEKTLETWAYENIYYQKNTYYPDKWDELEIPERFAEKEQQIQREVNTKEAYFERFNALLETATPEELGIINRKILYREDVKQTLQNGEGLYRVNHEVEFTATMHRPSENITIQNHPDYSNLGGNWDLHTSLVDRLKKGHKCIDLKEVEKEMIYMWPKENDLKMINEYRHIKRKQKGVF
tara:strand:+ start:331 stop:1440 length:1110 start_codon:yes stop_codon:yes gene_type:complete